MPKQGRIIRVSINQWYYLIQWLLTQCVFFLGGWGERNHLPIPPNILARRRRKFFGVYHPQKTKKDCERLWRLVPKLTEKKHSKNLIFGLVTSEILERREVPFSKHFAAVFFENLFLQIFQVPYQAKMLRLEMLNK